MPSSTITVQVGQCGNQLGMAFWERLCVEHGITPDGEVVREAKTDNDCKEIFFNEANCGQKWVPRAVMVDLEPRVLNEICNYDLNQYSDLFDVDNIYQGPTGGGAGNNWARGFNQSQEVVEDILAIIESEAERAEHLEGFALCHSVLGGTGSGLGSRLLQELRDRNGKKVIQTYSTVQPMTCNVQVAPYNIVLSLDAIMEHADMCLLFDNDAFEKQCKSVNPLQRLRRDGTHEDLSNLATNEKKNYAKINSMMSQVMTGLSAPVRFYSPVYTRIMHVTAMLNPFPPMIFSQPAFVPFVPTKEEGPKQQLIKFPDPRNVLSYLCDPRQLISSSPVILKKLREDEQKKAAESKGRSPQHSVPMNADEHRLIAGLIILQSTEVDPVMRFAGSVAPAGMGICSLYDYVRDRNRTQKNAYKSPTWMPMQNTLNLTCCRLSPYMKHDQHPVTGLLLANHTSVAVSLKAISGDFEKMWKKRANVHQFESAFSEDETDKESGKRNMEQKMESGRDKLEGLIKLYGEACTDGFLDMNLHLQQENVSPQSQQQQYPQSV